MKNITFKEQISMRMQSVMTTQGINYFNQISEIVKSNRLISTRITLLESMGFNVAEVAMGSGGVLQIQQLKNETRIQIGFGHARHNYAYAVILSNEKIIK